MIISCSDSLSVLDHDLLAEATFVLIIAIVAVIRGMCALMKKSKDVSVIGLAFYGGAFLLSAGLFSEGSATLRKRPTDLSDIAMSIWIKTAFVWALCYIGAAICAYMDNPD